MIMVDQLTHLNASGEAEMVDVSDKEMSSRVARARGRIFMHPDTLNLIGQNDLPKGDVLATARIAGIMAAKQTHHLIPLCHPLALSKISVELSAKTEPKPHILVEATVKLRGQTGVEMEALTAVSVACLTLYDMAKAVDKSMQIADIRLIEKTGGQSGFYRAEE